MLIPSTGLKNLILGTDSFNNIFLGGVVDLYDGTRPTNSDAAIGAAVHIARITKNGGSWSPGSIANGLEFLAPVSGIISLDDPTSFKIVPLVTGTPTWFRLKGNAADDNMASTMLPRIDGDTSDVITSDLVLEAAELVLGTQLNVNQFNLAF